MGTLEKFIRWLGALGKKVEPKPKVEPSQPIEPPVSQPTTPQLQA